MLVSKQKWEHNTERERLNLLKVYLVYKIKTLIIEFYFNGESDVRPKDTRFD